MRVDALSRVPLRQFLCWVSASEEGEALQETGYVGVRENEGDGFSCKQAGSALSERTSASYAVATTATRRPLKERCKDALCSDRSVARCCTAKASAWRVVHWALRLGLRRLWSGPSQVISRS